MGPLLASKNDDPARMGRIDPVTAKRTKAW
jgi:hypothetical protein